MWHFKHSDNRYVDITLQARSLCTAPEPAEACSAACRARQIALHRTRSQTSTELTLDRRDDCGRERARQVGGRKRSSTNNFQIERHIAPCDGELGQSQCQRPSASSAPGKFSSQRSVFRNTLYWKLCRLPFGVMCMWRLALHFSNRPGSRRSSSCASVSGA